MKNQSGVRVDAVLEQRREMRGFRGIYSDDYALSEALPYEEPDSLLTLYIGGRVVSIKLIPEQLQEASKIAEAITLGNIESDHPDHDWEDQGFYGVKCKRCGFEIIGHHHHGWRGSVPTCNEQVMKEALE